MTRLFGDRMTDEFRFQFQYHLFFGSQLLSIVFVGDPAVKLIVTEMIKN